MDQDLIFSIASLFLPGKFHGQWSLAGRSRWGLKELDTTEHTHTPADVCTHTHVYTAASLPWKSSIAQITSMPLSKYKQGEKMWTSNN